MRIKVTHLITGLNMGGAETMLYKLLQYTNQEKYQIKVISMTNKGVYGNKIEKLGLEVVTLDMKNGRPSIRGFRKALKHTKGTDVLQTWMYHADLLGYLLSKVTNIKKVIWGIRRSNLEPHLMGRTTSIIAKLNARFSKAIDKVVSCSIEGKKNHIAHGYYQDNIIFIPNGFELERFNPNENAREYLSDLIEKKIDIPYILHVARWNVIKDYNNLIQALGILKGKKINFHAILVGPKITNKNEELAHLIEKEDIRENVSLLGKRNDIPNIMAGSDVFVSSSSGEGFPNVVGEAMLCKTPCVVTDVGDSGYIVGDTGRIVPKQNPKKLA